MTEAKRSLHKTAVADGPPSPAPIRAARAKGERPLPQILRALGLACGLCACGVANPSHRTPVTPAVAEAPAPDTSGGAVPASAPPPVAPRSGPPVAKPEPAEEAVEVWIDTADRPLGAYTLTVDFDAGAAALAAVGGGGQDFARAPASDAGTYATGSVRLAGTLGGSADRPAPNGLVRVAALRFRVSPGRNSPLTVRIQSLFDPDGKPIAGKAVLSREKVGGRGPI